MKEILLTCPFTGAQFSATIDVNNNLYVTHPITNETHKINYNSSIKKYNLPAELLQWVETVSLGEAARILNVSRQRISAIAQNGTIQPRTVNGQTVFVLDDVLQYKETRKPGAPKKES